MLGLHGDNYWTTLTTSQSVGNKCAWKEKLEHAVCDLGGASVNINSWRHFTDGCFVFADQSNTEPNEKNKLLLSLPLWVFGFLELLSVETLNT